MKRLISIILSENYSFSSSQIRLLDDNLRNSNLSIRFDDVGDLEDTDLKQVVKVLKEQLATQKVSYHRT